MSKPLQTLEEAEAALLESRMLAYAREGVRMVRDETISFFGLPLSLVEKEDSRLLWKRWLKFTATTPDGLLDLYDDALAAEELAHEAMCELINEYRHNRRDLPPPLETYDMQVVRAAAKPERKKARKRGPKKKGGLLRDIALLYLVGDLCWKFKRKPTRNLHSKRDHLSACSVVERALRAEGMAISEPAIVASGRAGGNASFRRKPLRARIRGEENNFGFELNITTKRAKR
jgi:hypothetical protein